MMMFLGRLSRRDKRLIMVASDFVFLPLALYLAICIRQGTFSPQTIESWWLFLLAPVIAIPIFTRLGLYRAVVRYIEWRAELTIFKAVTLSTLAFSVVERLGGDWHVPRMLVYWMLSLLYVGGSRLAVRTYYQNLHSRHCEKQRVAIYGAGNAGAQLAKSIDAGSEYRTIAFFDDNPGLHGNSIGGVTIHNPARLPELIHELGIAQVLLAIPSASFSQRKAILTRLEPLPVHVKTIPALHDLVTGKVKVESVRDLDIEDLLGRDSVPPNERLLSACITDRAVLVTGAGGSIGSELCRQIIAAESRPAGALRTLRVRALSDQDGAAGISGNASGQYCRGHPHPRLGESSAPHGDDSQHL